MAGLFFGFGFLGLFAQFALFRELAVVFLGHEQALALSLASWLFWTGLGSFSQRARPEESSSDAGARSGRKIAFLCATAPLTVLAVRWAKTLTPAGGVPGLFEAVALPLLLLAPFCWLSGAAFGSLCAADGRMNRPGATEPSGEEVPPPRSVGKRPATGALGAASSAARLYLWESAGALAAGAFATFFAAGSLPVFPVLCGVGALVCLLDLRIARPWEAAAAGLVCVLLGMASPRLDPAGSRPGFGGLRFIEQKEGRYGHLAMAEVGSMKTLLVNGAAAVSFPDRASEEEAALWPLLAQPRPGRVLVLGCASLPSLAEVLAHPVKEVVVVEADAQALDMLRRRLDPRAAKALSDPRVRTVVADPREFIRQARSCGKESLPAAGPCGDTAAGAYDVILHMNGDPVSAASNRFFTREFFSEVRAALSDEGVFAFSLASAENYLSPETAYANASVLRSLTEVFGRDHAVIPGSRMTLLAGKRGITLDPVRLGETYGKRRLKNTFLVPPAFPYQLMPERRQALERRLAGLGPVRANEDLRPIAAFHAWRLWLVKFVSPAHLLGLIAVAGVALWGLSKLWLERRLVFSSWESGAVFSLGFSGIAAEVVLLLAFQAACGALYWKMGILMAAFMGGLALGALVGALKPLGPPWSPVALRLVLAAMGLATLAGSARLGSLVALDPGSAALAFCGALACAGFLVGWAFPLACSSAPAEVYAADLCGAALGAFVAAAFLVPLAGMSATLAVAAAAVLPAALWPFDIIGAGK